LIDPATARETAKAVIEAKTTGKAVDAGREMGGFISRFVSQEWWARLLVDAWHSASGAEIQCAYIDVLAGLSPLIKSLVRMTKSVFEHVSQLFFENSLDFIFTGGGDIYVQRTSSHRPATSQHA
jgi:hypothetical protein